jgi:RnfABCDGE-type electron transport complex G subunit
MLKKIREVSILFLVGITSAFLLSFVYKKTAPLISKYSEGSLNESLNEVFGDSSVRFEEVKADTLWKVFKEEKYIGIVFRSEGKGYSSTIRPIIGVDSTGKIKGVKIPKAELSETPGLGMKVAEESFLNQFNNLVADDIWLKKDKQEGKIDAVTSATISSRATTDAVREGLIRYRELMPGHASREFLKTSLEYLQNSTDSTLKEIIPGKLWQTTDNFLYLSTVEDSSFVFRLLTQIENKRIKDISIFIENKESQKEETSKASKDTKEYLEREFKNVLIKNIQKLKFTSEFKDIAEKIRKEIKTGYTKYIKGREK